MQIGGRNGANMPFAQKNRKNEPLVGSCFTQSSAFWKDTLKTEARFAIDSALGVLKEKLEKMAKSWTKTQVAVYMPYGERHHTTQNHGKIEENGAKMDNHRFFRWIYLIEKRSISTRKKHFSAFFIIRSSFCSKDTHLKCICHIGRDDFQPRIPSKSNLQT